ncbi:MAG: T9SS type A sorting domain-containing protein [Chitinophagales bacterium]|jgi:hypothetical protein|nr:T9SS type A sorting domain-containing protein [Sphingobacteriales bacterium]MCC7056462.1 T9SS type A sorting domain-containing protein [Chitinophagales bacterium]
MKLFLLLAWQATIHFINPSFEGVPRNDIWEDTIALGWDVCMPTPDLGGYYDFALIKPTDGLCYIQIAHFPDWGNESFMQKLSCPLVAHCQHTFYVDAYRAFTGKSSNVLNGNLFLWGGMQPCAKDQLLWAGTKSGSSLESSMWHKDTITFIPNQHYPYMLFEAGIVDPDTISAVRLDYLSPIYIDTNPAIDLQAENTAICKDSCTIIWVPSNSFEKSLYTITWSSIPEGYSNNQNISGVTVCPTENTQYVVHATNKKCNSLVLSDTLLLTVKKCTPQDTTTNPIDTFSYQPVKGATRYKPPGGWALFPNMVAPGGSVNIHTPQAGQLALYNTLGQLVWSVAAIPLGYNAYNLPNNLAQGIYYYHFTPNNPEEEKKPVIMGKILLVGGGG